jgi:MFS transporter, FHS family, glucose/mannose:H+ symporter
MISSSPQRMSRLPLYLTQFISGVVWVSIGPLLNSILRDLGIPLSRGGIVSLAFFLGSVIGLVSLNVLLARVPIRSCLVGAGLLEAAALAAAGLLSFESWSLLLSFFFAGFASVILGAVPGMWLSAHVKEGNARALTVMMMSSVSAMTLTPIVLGVLLNSGATWRSILAGEAVFALVLTSILAVLPLADIPRRENLRPRQVRAVIAFNPRLLAGIVAAAFLYLGAEMTLIVWLPKFESDVFGASATWASLSVTFYFIGQIVGRLIVIPFTRRFLPSSLLFVCAIAMGVFAGLIGLAPSQAVSLALIFCAGLGSSGAFSFIGSYAAKFPDWHAGVVFSAFQLAGGVGGMVFPYLTGPLAVSAGFKAAIAFAAVPALMVAFLALRLRQASGEARLPARTGVSG